MFNDYDQITATHFVAYRPALHGIILRTGLDNLQLGQGLDIGCGTGHSAIALTEFCQQVVAIDSSQEMLKKVTAHPNIIYQCRPGYQTGLKDKSFDVITLAGSLNYIKSQELVDEVIRLLRKNGVVLIYDFEILLDDVFKLLQMDKGRNDEAYDHEIDFSGLKHEPLNLSKKQSENVKLTIHPDQLAHLILALKGPFHYLKDKYQKTDPYLPLRKTLQEITNAEPWKISGRIFLTRYDRMSSS